jgi:hypothetical protein
VLRIIQLAHAHRHAVQAATHRADLRRHGTRIARSLLELWDLLGDLGSHLDGSRAVNARLGGASPVTHSMIETS